MDVAILKFFQSIRCKALNAVLIPLTSFGEETLLALAVMAVLYCINKNAGIYIAVTVLFSLALNAFLKGAFMRERPFAAGVVSKVYIKSLTGESIDSTWSFPSGHAQICAAAAAAVALRLKDRAATAALAAVAVLVMLSRLYLGVHYPSDVLVGAALGAAAAVFWNALFVRDFQGMLLLFAAFAFAALVCMLFSLNEQVFKAAGAAAGAALGLTADNMLLRFDTVKKNFKQNLVRLIIGAALLLTVQIALKAALPAGLFYAFIRYFILLFTMTFLYPALF